MECVLIPVNPHWPQLLKAGGTTTQYNCDLSKRTTPRTTIESRKLWQKEDRQRLVLIPIHYLYARKRKQERKSGLRRFVLGLLIYSGNEEWLKTVGFGFVRMDICSTPTPSPPLLYLSFMHFPAPSTTRNPPALSWGRTWRLVLQCKSFYCLLVLLNCHSE